MVRLADNTGYLTIDGVDVSQYVREVELSHSGAEIDVTAGFGQEYTQREPGLKDTSISIILVYEVGAVDTYIDHIASAQKLNIEHGPEGAVSGKPRHVQDFTINGTTGPKKVVTKDLVVFSISANGADTPTVDMYAGGTYA